MLKIKNSADSAEMYISGAIGIGSCLYRLFVNGRQKILHIGHGRISSLHPGNTRLDIALELVVLRIGILVAEELGVVHRVIRRTMEPAAIGLFHEFCLVFVAIVELLLVAAYHLCAAYAHRFHLSFQLQ